MDIKQITDVKELKAMAYDQYVLKEQVEHNLRIINERITELQSEPKPQEPKSK